MALEICLTTPLMTHVDAKVTCTGETYLEEPGALFLIWPRHVSGTVIPSLTHLDICGLCSSHHDIKLCG